jgi:hypothetical protein
MKEKLLEKIIEKYLLWEEESVVATETSNPFIWQYVIVRGYDAWVWCGKLIDATPWNIILEDARNLWRRWCKEWIGLSWLASHWLADRDEVKVLETQKKVLITDNRVSTFFEVNKKVEKQLREWKTAQQS